MTTQEFADKVSEILKEEFELATAVSPHTGDDVEVPMLTPEQFSKMQLILKISKRIEEIKL